MKKWVFLSVSLFLMLSVFLIPPSYLASTSLAREHGSKIGILSVNELRLEKVKGLKAELKQCSLGEEIGLEYTVLNANNDTEKLSEYAETLVQKKPDVLVAAGAPETRALQAALKKANESIPLVFMGTLSPVQIGLVEDAERPSGNVTGLNNYHFELTPKRLELLHCLLPEVQKIGVLGDSRINFYKLAPIALEKVAQKYSLDFAMYSITDLDQVDHVFKKMKSEQREAVLLLPGFFMETTTTKLIEAAKSEGLPIFGVYPGDAEKGGLASFGTSYFGQGAQSAHLVHKILTGCKPEELPVETPDKVDFVVNLKSARELGIELAPSVLSLADRIIRE